MVRDHPERAGHRLRFAGPPAGPGRYGLKNGREKLRIVHGCIALQHGNGPLHAHAGVDIVLLERNIGAGRGFFVLHENVVPYLEVLAAPAARPAIRAACRAAQVNEHLGVRPAWACLPCRAPPVFFHAEKEDMRSGHAQLFPDSGRLVIRGHVLVALEHRHVQALQGKSEIFGRGQEFERPAYGLFLEIIAERPAAEHLEKSQVRCVANRVNVARANAFLNVAKPAAGRMRFAQQVGHQRMHAGCGEKHGRVILGNQGGAGNDLVPFPPPIIKKHRSQFVRCNASAHFPSLRIIIDRPRSFHARTEKNHITLRPRLEDKSLPYAGRFQSGFFRERVFPPTG